MVKRAAALSLLLTSLATAASDGALCFRVDLGRGWPVLRRTTAALTKVREPLHPAYAGKADDVLTVAFGAGGAPKPRLEADGWRAVYRLPDGEASVRFGRFSPAVLFESEGKELSLVTATKYLACVRDGKVAIGPADRKAIGPADEPWLLLWFGDRTPLLGSTVPYDVNDKSGVDKGRLETLAKEKLDLPLLVRFEHRPAAAAWSPQRGLTFAFGDAVGKVAIVPLFGRRVFTPTETEAWANALPDEVLRACRQWSRVLRDVPVGVRETHAIDTKAGSVTIGQEFTWTSFEDDWQSPPVYAAPLPPMLALALGGGVPVTFLRDGQEVKPTDYGFMDRSGKAMAVEGARAYSYRVDGLGRYLWHRRGRGKVAEAAKPLQAQLERHVADMVDAGHLAPLLYIYGGIGGTWYSHFYWVGSPELAHALAMAHPYLSKGLQAKVVDYLKSEWQAYPPFTIGNADYTEGAPRAPYSMPWEDIGAHVGRPKQRDLAYRRQSFFFDLYRAHTYYELTGERPDAAKLRQQAGALAQALESKIDWALLGPVRLQAVRDKQSLRYFSLQGQATYNTWAAGAIGLARLARKFGWPEEERRAHVLFAKLALARVAQARFVPEMHRMGLVRGEAKDDWRTLLHIDETCTIVGWGPLMAGVFQDQELPPFNDLIEEVGLLLGADAQPACRSYLDYLDYAIPFWYLSEGPKLQATEHRTLPLQHYNGNVLAQFWVLGKKGDAFRRYVDVSRFRGDLYLIQNLVAAIDSYGE